MDKRSAEARPSRWVESEGRKDLATALGLLGFAIGAFVFINSDGASVYLGPGGISWRTMPFIYAGGLVALSLIYIAQSIAKIVAERAETPDRPDPARAAEDRLIVRRRWITLALLLTYAATLKLLGFVIVTPVFLFLLFRLYARGRWRGDLALSLVGGLALWGLFVRILKLNLKGTWFDPVTPFLLDALKLLGL